MALDRDNGQLSCAALRHMGINPTAKPEGETRAFLKRVERRHRDRRWRWRLFEGTGTMYILEHRIALN